MGEGSAGAEWRAGYDRIRSLAEQCGDDGLAMSVPACPDWSARQLLAHMIGVGTDALTGDVPDDTNPGWTQGHIDARADSTTADLLAEWSGRADEIEAFVDSQDPSPLADLLIHEQDLRGALRTPGAQDTAGLGLVRDTVLGQVAAALPDADAPLELRATDRDWSWRSGDGEPGAVVQAPLFDLTRAVTSRRTADQLRGWTVQGSVEPYLDAFGGMGPLPDHPLPEV